MPLQHSAEPLQHPQWTAAQLLLLCYAGQLDACKPNKTLFTAFLTPSNQHTLCSSLHAKYPDDLMSRMPVSNVCSVLHTQTMRCMRNQHTTDHSRTRLQPAAKAFFDCARPSQPNTDAMNMFFVHVFGDITVLDSMVLQCSSQSLTVPHWHAVWD